MYNSKMKYSNPVNLKKVFSSHAVITHNKKLLFFLRDDNPNIPDPNTWSLVGGEIDTGESHQEAMIREMQEEISVVPKNIKYLGMLATADGRLHAIYLSKMTEDEVEQIQIGNEGQKVQFFETENIDKLRLATNLGKYFEV